MMLKSVAVTMAILVTSQSALAQHAANAVPTSRSPSERVVTYVGNQPAPANPVQLTEMVSVSRVIPENLVLSSIPGNPEYSFLFVNQKRVIVVSRTRVVALILD
jgi:hypothetical protein